MRLIFVVVCSALFVNSCLANSVGLSQRLMASESDVVTTLLNPIEPLPFNVTTNVIANKSESFIAGEQSADIFYQNPRIQDQPSNESGFLMGMSLNFLKGNNLNQDNTLLINVQNEDPINFLNIFIKQGAQQS